MNETVKLYDLDAYRTEFTAKVVSCEPDKNGLAVVLDQTLFFPEEGGQSPDCGKINGYAVTDVQIKNGIITHFLKLISVEEDSDNKESMKKAEKELQPGNDVSGMIDWDVRFSNMQNHTGEHILSGLIHKYYGYENVGFHLSPQVVTMDMNGYLSWEQLTQIENEANTAVFENVEVIAEFPDKAVLSQLDYRSKIEIDGDVRIVTVKGYDVCACCAPHVARTGEIGLIKIIKSEKYKGGIRLTILCGSRALLEIQERQNQMTQLCQMLSAKPEVVVDAVKRIQDENGQLKADLADVQTQIVQTKVGQIPDGQENAYIFEESLDAGAHRNFVNLLTQKCTGICAVFVGNDEAGYRYIIGSAHADTRIVNNVLKEKFGAKGGGKPEMVQGSLVGTKAEIQETLQL